MVCWLNGLLIVLSAVSGVCWLLSAVTGVCWLLSADSGVCFLTLLSADSCCLVILLLANSVVYHLFCLPTLWFADSVLWWLCCLLTLWFAYSVVPNSVVCCLCCPSTLWSPVFVIPNSVVWCLCCPTTLWSAVFVVPSFVVCCLCCLQLCDLLTLIVRPSCIRDQVLVASINLTICCKTNGNKPHLKLVTKQLGKHDNRSTKQQQNVSVRWRQVFFFVLGDWSLDGCCLTMSALLSSVFAHR